MVGELAACPYTSAQRQYFWLVRLFSARFSRTLLRGRHCMPTSKVVAEGVANWVVPALLLPIETKSMS